MKNLKSLSTALIVTFYLLLSTFNSSAQNVGINDTGAIPDASALLDLSSVNKGFLITRVDTSSIASPAFGLMTLAPSDSCLYLYSGTKWVGMGGGGSNCSCNSVAVPPSSFFPCGGTVTPVVDVTSPTGKVWMDRNLGASQVATSSTDSLAYGDLYQWGRCSDGHEKRTSDTTATQSTGDIPGHSDFIIRSADWRSPKNDSLWQGVAGINNPCPTGYRIPTETELIGERLFWATDNAAGAFASPLKLSMGGMREANGPLNSVGPNGYCWSSTISTNISSTYARYLNFNSVSAMLGNAFRTDGLSVRCIKD